MTSSNPAFAAPRTPATGAFTMPARRSLREWFLRAPLITKLLGANLVIAVVAVGVATVGRNAAAIGLIMSALALSFAVNAFLVRLALSPLDDLERAAERVSRGENYSRVPKSGIADERIVRLGATFNRLLESIRSDHAHIHQLIRRGLAARETERALLSHELREGVAQQLTALALQLAVAEGAFGRDPGLAALRESRDLSAKTVEAVRRLADSTYPGLLHELGLPASLVALAARVSQRSPLRVSIEPTGVAEHLSPALATAMYRVAEEVVRNAELHSGARSVRMLLAAAGGILRLDVIDDGRGFDVAAAERSGAGAGLFEARELLANVHGRLDVLSSASGTHVIATARLDQGDTC